MRLQKWFTIALLCNVVLPVAADWPQWRGPTRDGHSAESGLLTAWPEDGPALRWKKEGLGRGWSSPVIANDTLVITGDEGEHLMLHALDMEGGTKWSVANGRAWTGSYPGARSCGSMVDGVLYHMNAHGRLAAFDLDSGRERWAVDVLERFGAKNITWGFAENLLVENGRIIVTPAGSLALMAALDVRDGSTLWTTTSLEGEEAAYCSPVVWDVAGQPRTLVTCTSHHAFGVASETGRLLWKVPMRGQWGASVAPPVIGPSHIFFTAPAGPNGFAAAPDPTQPEGVRMVWTSTIDALTGGALRVGNRLFAAGCKNSKTLHTLDWNTGNFLYELPRPFTERTAGHASAAMVWADNRLYTLLEDGHMLLLEPLADRFESHGFFRPIETRRQDAWAHPVVLDGRLFLRYHETLLCYTISAPSVEP